MSLIEGEAILPILYLRSILSMSMQSSLTSPIRSADGSQVMLLQGHGRTWQSQQKRWLQGKR